MYEKLVKVLQNSENIVFFGGAGVSTESGIPDFRSSAGIYSKKHYPYPAEHMISIDFFEEHPHEFYDFYFHEMIYPDALPNQAHLALAQLEAGGKLKAVITQNIDGLHQLAGSKEVMELHGSIHRNHCPHCHASYDVKAMWAQKDQVPRCSACHHILKPDVVLYGESLPMDVLEKAISYISQADVVIVGGTSLVVYPAAGLLQYFKGTSLVLINKGNTQMDEHADIVIHEPIAKVMSEVMKQM